MKRTQSLVALLIALVACNQEMVRPTSGISGAITKSSSSTVSVPSGKIALYYIATSESPDRAYIVDAGEFSQTGFDVSPLSAAPPASALNTYGELKLGVAVLIAARANETIPVGEDLGQESVNLFMERALGASPRHAIIFRQGPAAANSWMNSFPEGYSCGVGVPAAAGERFDTYRPVSCDEVEVVLTDDLDSLDFVDWT